MNQSTSVVIGKILYEIHHPSGDTFQYKVVSQKRELGWIYIESKDPENDLNIWSGSNIQLRILARDLGHAIDFYNDGK